ncbi:MAG: hypothetical protein AB7T48_11515, partial [Solirubrobacterales bacterium]
MHPQPSITDPAGALPGDSTLAPASLADRLARLEPLTILDVRADAGAPIEAASATQRHLPATQALADLEQLAAQLEGPVVVVCDRGLTAAAVTDGLRARGVDAMVLGGGMRGWIATLQAFPVELGIDGLDVILVQRPGRGCLSYLLTSAGEAIVVDPAPEARFYAELAGR